MIKIVKNRFLDAFFKLMLLSAAIHIGVLLYVACTHLDPSPLNYFHIVSLDLVFPGITEGTMRQVSSLLIGISLYLTIFFFATTKN